MKKFSAEFSWPRVCLPAFSRPSDVVALALLVVAVVAWGLPASLVAQTSASVATGPKKPCPEPKTYGNLFLPWTNPYGDVEFVITAQSGVGAGGTFVSTNPGMQRSPESGAARPWPSEAEQGISLWPDPPDPDDPCPDDGNNICDVAYDPEDNPVGCVCEIGLKPKGFKGPAPIHVPGPPESLSSGGWFQPVAMMGEGLSTYTFWGSSGYSPHLEVRGVDGTISVYEQFGTPTSTKRRLKLVEFIDDHDNSTRYEYDSQSQPRITAVHRPDGVTENWNYAPSWITDTGGWGANYSGIEVTYSDNTVSQNQALPQFTYYMLFKKPTSSSGGPLLGDQLYRVYWAKSLYLDALSGSPGTTTYGLPTTSTPERHRVDQFTYDGTSDRILTVDHLMADGIWPSDSTTTPTKVKEFTYVTAGDRMRVAREVSCLTGRTDDFTYTIDTTENSRVDEVEVHDQDGVVTVTKFDDNQRPTSVVRTPPNDAAGRPRAYDAQANDADVGGGFVEPTSITIEYEYGSCAGCQSKPTKITESPSGRQVTYTYDGNGLVTSVTEPDPAGGTGVATTYYSWSPVVSGDIHGTYKLDSKKTPDSKIWSYTYATASRFTPSGALGRGRKITQQTETSPTIGGSASPSVVSSVVTYDYAAPTFSNGRQQGLVGFVTSIEDGDGKETAFQHTSLGFLQEVEENPNGMSADRVKTTFSRNRIGQATQVITNASSSLSQAMDLVYNGDERLASISGTVNGVSVETKYYYDLWGNQAVTLRKNTNSGGSAPDDWSPTSPRSDTARGWLRDEVHYVGDQPIARLTDRRPLDMNESGSLTDAADARFQLNVFVWSPSGRLLQRGNPNGATTEFTYDGYGSLFKVETVSGSSTVLDAKWFVNNALEPVREVRGDGTLKLVSKITRNAAGVVTQVVEPTVGAPSGYPSAWPVASAIHEFTTDVMGRTTEERTYADGTTPTLLKKVVTTYDALSRPYVVDVFLGSGTSASQTYETVWNGVSKVRKVTGPGDRCVEQIFDGLTRVVEEQRSATGLSSVPIKTVYTYQDNTSWVRRVEQVNEDEASSATVTRQTDYVRDAFGRVLQIKHGPTGTPLTHMFTYFSTGQTESYTDPLGKVEKYLPDATGRLVERFRPGDHPIWNGTEYHDWTNTNDRTEMVQIDGRLRRTTTIHDFAGRVLAVMEPGAAAEPSASNKNEAFARFLEYDAASRLTDIYSGDGGHLHLDRDGMGRMLRRTASGSNSWVSAFYGGDFVQRNALGQVIYTKSFFQGGTEFLHEEFDRDALGRTNRESFAYYPGYANWTDVESSFTNGDPIRTGLTYDNNLSGGADNLTIAFTVDAVGRLESMSWQPTGVTSPADLASYLHEGDAIRRRTTSSLSGTPSPFASTYKYDLYGRMEEIGHSFDSTAGVKFHYDAASNLENEEYTKQSNSALKGDRFAYDEHNRLLKAWLGSDTTHWNATNPDGGVGGYVKSLTYGLDAANNRTTVDAEAGNGGSVTSAVYSTQDDGEEQGASNRYDEVDGVKPWYDERGNTIFDGQHYFVYDALNRLTEVYVLNSSQQSQMAQQSSSATAAGASEGATAGGGGAGTIAPAPPSYVITDISALRQARANILGRVNGEVEQILLRYKEPGFAEVVREPMNPALAQISVSPPTSTQSSSTMQMESSTASSSSVPALEELDLQLVAVYAYDIFDRRVIRLVMGANIFYYAWDGWEEAQEMVPEVVASSLVTRPINQFAWGEQLDELVAYRHGAPGSMVDYYVAEGGAHCPSRVLDGNSNAPVEVQEYDPYGKTTFFSGGTAHENSQIANPYGWKGHRIDQETGLVYMRHRFYSAEWGRFVNQDPLGAWTDSWNMGNSYVYVGGNPLTREDRDGTQTVLSWMYQLTYHPNDTRAEFLRPAADAMKVAAIMETVAVAAALTGGVAAELAVGGGEVAAATAPLQVALDVGVPSAVETALIDAGVAVSRVLPTLADHVWVRALQAGTIIVTCDKGLVHNFWQQANLILVSQNDPQAAVNTVINVLRLVF